MIQDDITFALLKYGWKIDPTEVENKYGELRNFIHPESGKKYTLYDAIEQQEYRELNIKDI